MDALNIKDLVQKTKKLKVVFVEDDENTRQQALKIFSTFFDYVDVAVDGYDGLEKYKSAIVPYDLVISDINMAKMNGIEMSKAIFALNHQQKILIISAYNNSEQLMEVMDIGVSHFIHKPIKIESFIVELQKIILIIEREEKEKNDFDEIKMINHELDALIKNFNTYVIATRTDLKGIITYSSKAFEEISGYTEAELMGQSHNIVRHPDMSPAIFKDMWATIQSQKLWTGEIKNLTKDGSFFWVKTHVAPYYDKNDKHIGYSSIRTDITDQKEIEKLNIELSLSRELLEKQNNQLRETAQLREDVENITRHDLKSPINGMIGFADLLINDEELNASQREYVTLIKDLGYRSINMVNLSLGMVKMEHGSYQLESKPMDLLLLFRGILIDINSRINYKKIKVSLIIDDREADDEDTFFAMGENLLSYSMFANLLKNAVEASPAKNNITVKFYHPSETMTAVAIHNSGSVPEKIRDSFFEKYVTFGKSTGTGLGTYSARLIAETQKGKIMMESSDETGTTITVTLPARI